MLHIRGNVVTLADFGLIEAARPVLYRQREIVRKRVARVNAKRDKALTIICKDGRIIRPIRGA